MREMNLTSSNPPQALVCVNSCSKTLSRRLIASIGVNGQPNPLFVASGIAPVAISDFVLRSDHCCEAPVSVYSIESAAGTVCHTLRL